jgi:importin subunit alpha-6/7
MAGDCPLIRDLIINAGTVEPVADLLDRTNLGLTFVRNASWTLSNLCRGIPSPDFN